MLGITDYLWRLLPGNPILLRVVEAAGKRKRDLAIRCTYLGLLVFIVVHILHFTTGAIRPAGVFSREDVYANVVTSFRIWWVTLFYVVAMIALGLHVFHGAWSSVRSIGVSPPSPKPLHRRLSLVVAVLVWAAFTAIPLAVFLGIVR